MANLVEEAKIQINALLASAQKRACERGELPEADALSGTVEIPKEYLMDVRGIDRKGGQ